MSHTYVVLAVSQAAYDEIRGKLAEAGYQHSFNGEEIDMHGLALAPDENYRVDQAAPR